MSRRHNRSTRQGTEQVCTWACGRPTRDNALVCDTCLDGLAVGLRDLQATSGGRPDPLRRHRSTSTDIVLRSTTSGAVLSAGSQVVEWCEWPRRAEVVPGLWDELRATLTGERGIDYGALGGSGGSGERGVVETGLVLHEAASEIAGLLTEWLRHLILLCRQYRLDHVAPAEWQPRSTRLVPAMAEWLSWRVDSFAWHPEAAEAADQISRLIEQARWVVDRPATRQQLGPCPVEGCDGQVSAVQGAAWAMCYRDRSHSVEAQPLRDRLLDELGDRLCTAAEIARLSTYLGLRADRDRVRESVNLWAHRERISASSFITPTAIDATGVEAPVPPLEGPVCRRCDHLSCPDVIESRGAPLYRFGNVYALLLKAEAQAVDRTAKTIPTQTTSKPTTTTSKGA